MRQEIIRCDKCKKEHDAQYYLPTEWITTKQRNRFDCDEEKHFCSKSCLIAWASEEEQDRNPVPITGVRLKYTDEHIGVFVCKDKKWYKIIYEVAREGACFSNMVTDDYFQELLKEENMVNI